MKIIAGTSSERLGGEITRELGTELTGVEIARFPDGECYVRVKEDLTDEEVFLISNSHPDENIIELFLLQDAINLFRIGRLTTIIPYFGYGRQDRVFREGEPVSARSMVKRIEMATDRIITVDVHETKMIDWFRRPASCLSAMGRIGGFLKDKGVDIIISPDRGGIDLASKAASAVDLPHSFLIKKRIDANTVRMEAKDIDLAGMSVGIVDDIVSTGGTVVRAAENIASLGAERIYAGITHGLFAGDSLDRLRSSLDGIYATDSIEGPVSAITLAPIIKEAILNSENSE